MASISAHIPHKLNLKHPKFSAPIRRPYYPSPCSLSFPFHLHSHSHSLSADPPTLCRCYNPASDSPTPSDDNSLNPRWDSLLHDVFSSALKRFDSLINLLRNDSQGEENATGVAERDAADEGDVETDDEEWDWNRWSRHFQEVDEQERLVSILKSDLSDAIYLEDYEDAARLKVAIAAAAVNDSVARAMSHLNRAIEEERYSDAAFLRDKAGAGLVGWWAGLSNEVNEPHGLIIRITPEHGRYVARSYNPRQLATSAAGVPLFELFLTINKRGEYKSQAVYLKQRGSFHGPPTTSTKALDATERLSSAGSTEDKGELFVVTTDHPENGDERNDDSDPAEGMPGFQNVLKDMIPGFKVKVYTMTTTTKIDKDLISKVIEQIIEEEEAAAEEEEDDDDEEEEEEEEDDEGDEKHDDTVILELEDIKSGADQEGDNRIGINDGLETFEIEEPRTSETDEQNEMAVKVVIGGLVQKLSRNLSTREFLRVPAKLESKGRCSFSFIVDKEVNKQEGCDKGEFSPDKSAKTLGQHRVDHVMFDLAKFIGRGKKPSKVLKDVGELISLTISQTQNHQPLSGSTIFNRIEIPASSDPLSGLYIGAHGLFSSEVIQLRRKFGQWQEDSGAKEPLDLGFYEYVEALKLTGDRYVPAGQVAFRAKMGKMYQLPHKGIIPEEFGVIARYKGQGRLAEPGFKNPRWVDGELVVLDGKYIKAGPVVGFVYWAPQFHFLVFFNRLRLQQ